MDLDEGRFPLEKVVRASAGHVLAIITTNGRLLVTGELKASRGCPCVRARELGPLLCGSCLFTDALLSWRGSRKLPVIALGLIGEYLG